MNRTARDLLQHVQAIPHERRFAFEVYHPVVCQQLEQTQPEPPGESLLERRIEKHDIEPDRRAGEEF